MSMTWRTISGRPREFKCVSMTWRAIHICICLPGPTKRDERDKAPRPAQCLVHVHAAHAPGLVPHWPQPQRLAQPPPIAALQTISAAPVEAEPCHRAGNLPERDLHDCHQAEGSSRMTTRPTSNGRKKHNQAVCEGVVTAHMTASVSVNHHQASLPVSTSIHIECKSYSEVGCSRC